MASTLVREKTEDLYESRVQAMFDGTRIRSDSEVTLPPVYVYLQAPASEHMHEPPEPLPAGVLGQEYFAAYERRTQAAALARLSVEEREAARAEGRDPLDLPAPPLATYTAALCSYIVFVCIQILSCDCFKDNERRCRYEFENWYYDQYGWLSAGTIREEAARKRSDFYLFRIEYMDDVYGRNQQLYGNT